MRDYIKPKGKVNFLLKDKDGNVKLDQTVPNLVVNTGLNWIVDRMLNTNTVMSHMGVGTGAVAPGAGDTDLGTQQDAKVALDSSVDNGDSTVTFQATFGTGSWIAALTEAGIFNSGVAATGDMLCRTTFSAINKGTDDTLVITWTIDFNAV